MKNAIQNVTSSLDGLQTVKASLQQALETVEKPGNKKMIQDSLCAVEKSIESVQCTMNNYKESPR